MKLTDTQTALVGLIEKRHALIVERDRLNALLTADTGHTPICEYWHVVGQIDGLGQAIAAFEDAEPVRSLEYIAIKPEARKSTIPLDQWQV